MIGRSAPEFARALGLRTGFLLLATLSASLGHATIVAQRPVQTDGRIDAMTLLGETLYLGGAFTYVGSYTGAAIPLDPVTGAPPAGFPIVEGIVYSVAPDGQGGWLIGGSFSSVGGVPRSNIARIRSDFTVDSWNPNAFAITGGAVRALIVSGTTVYAAGDFAFIGGQPRNRIAALDASTGAATTWCGGTNGTVRALALSGTLLYAGGDFSMIEPPSGVGCPGFGQTRHFLAAFDVTTGVIAPWNPDADAPVNALAAAGGAIYAGGGFLNVGGQARQFIAALNPNSGAPTSWNPALSFSVGALIATGTAIYVGSGGVRAIDPGPSAAELWSNAGAGSVALALDGSTLYFGAGGDCAPASIGALDAATGLPTAWSSRLNAPVYALAADGSAVFAGGRFTSAGGVPRNGTAAVNTSTWAVTGWDPGAGVAALAAGSNVVFAAGHFGSIGGASRDFVAALDPTTGAATPWNANITTEDFWKSGVWELALTGSTLYMTGSCCISGIGGSSRTNQGAVDVSTAIATPWDPAPPTEYVHGIHQLAVSGGVVYVCGERSETPPWDGYLAALDATTGSTINWSPAPDGPVYAVAPGPGVVYAGGEFGTIGGASRLRLAALDPTSATATAWNADANGGSVRALALSGGVLYAGGAFTAVGPQSRNHIAALNPSTGEVLPWDPSLPTEARTLVVGGGKVYADGNEVYGSCDPQRSIGYIAAIAASAAPIGVSGPKPGESTFALNAPMPSLLRTTARLAFDLPAAGKVWLELFDTAGRKVVGLLEGAECPAGHNEVRLERGSMVGGLYFARLRRAGQAAIQKLVVLP